MSDRNFDHIYMDHRHSAAVCGGIGERLRDALAKESPVLPRQLETLMDQLRELDDEIAPSVVPEMP